MNLARPSSSAITARSRRHRNLRGSHRLFFAGRNLGAAERAALVLGLSHGVVCLVNVLGLMVALSSTNDSDEPWCSSGSFPGPVFFEVVLARFEEAAGDEDDETD